MEGRRNKKSYSVKTPKKEAKLIFAAQNKKSNHNRKESHNFSNSQNFANKIIQNASPLINFKSKTVESNKELIDLNGEHLSIDILKKEYPRYENGDCSQKPFGIIKSFAYNTYHGLIKEENEDKISICVNLKKPNNIKTRNWPKISYFSIFDGHGGDKCSIFLMDNLLNYIIEDKNFPIDIKSSLISSIEKAENDFNKQFENLNNDNIKDYNDKTDFSGSCALICLIVDNKIYLCNVGDSRAIMSMENGSKIRPLTIDHKPNNPKEYDRIVKNGGKVYIDNEESFRDNNDNLKFINNEKEFDNYVNDDVIYRIFPSDLAVSRTIGDPKAKLKNLGGFNNQIIFNPEVFTFDNSSSCDFIILGCDGIYE